MPKESDLFKEIFLYFIMRDIVWSAPYKERSIYAEQCINNFSDSNVSVYLVLSLINQATFLYNTQFRTLNPVYVVGEPACLFDSLLNNNLFLEAENNGYRLQYMPLSEYLWFMLKASVQKNLAKK